MGFNLKNLIKFLSILLALILLFIILYGGGGGDDLGSGGNDLTLSASSSIAENNAMYPRKPTVGLHSIIRSYPMEKSISPIYINQPIPILPNIEQDLNVEKIPTKTSLVFVACAGIFTMSVLTVKLICTE